MSNIRLMIADVDGTLLTPAKVLTERARTAVKRLREAGIAFAITSGRPPRGMSMLVGPLELTTPMAGFNGGMLVHPDLSPIEEQTLPEAVVPQILETIDRHGLDMWLYRGADWFVRDPMAPHVDREQRTVKFAPTVVASFDGLHERVVKIVGVSDDGPLVIRCEADVRGALPGLLPRRHPPERQQGRRRQAPIRALEGSDRRDRDHRGHAERRPDVRAQRPQHRCRQRQLRGPTRGTPDLLLERGGRLRQCRRALRAAAASQVSQ
jgi:hypothetical protein